MNCIFNSFDKKTANPFLQANKNDPGKFMFPTSTELTQAAQFPKQSRTFSFGNATSGSQPQQFQPLFQPPQQPFQPLFQPPQQPFQPLFQPPQPFQPLFQPKQSEQTETFYKLFSDPLDGSHINAKQKIPVKITKFTSNIPIEKLLAILSSDSYVRDENITTVTQLNPGCDPNDITKVAPFAVAAFVDESVTIALTPLTKLHVKFLQELVQETPKNGDDVWNCATYLATTYGLHTVVHSINEARHLKSLIIQKQQISPEVAFVIALHAFATNDNKPHEVMSVSKLHSDTTAKLASDMCMASYGLSWILETQTLDYIRKHKDTYILQL